MYHKVSVKLMCFLFLPLGLFANGLELDVAIKTAIKNNPTIKSLQKHIENKKLSALSEVAYPNPELEFELGEFLGTNGYSGFKNSSQALSLSQEIVLGGKTKKSLNIHDAEIRTIQLEIKKEKIETAYRVKKIFTEILILKELYALTKENQSITSEILTTVKNKMEHGSNTELDVLKANIEFQQGKVTLKKEEKEMMKLMAVLLSELGEQVNLEDIKGKLDESFMLTQDGKQEWTGILEHNIDIKVQASTMKVNKHILNFEKSNRIPNLTVKLGINRFQEANDYAFTLGVSMPLPIWNSNKNKIKAVYVQMEESKLQKEAIEREVNKTFLENFHQLKNLKAELDALKGQVIPMAEKSLALAKEGYKEGEFRYLELLDAQKTFIEMKKQYIDVFKEYALLKLDMEYLKGSL